MDDSLAIENGPVVYRLEGQILDGSAGLGMGDVVVDVEDAEGHSRDLVAHATTNALGEFTITIPASHYESLFLDRRPDLKLRLYRNGQYPQPELTWKPSETTTHLRIPLYDLSRRHQDKPARMVVSGRVLQANGTPVVGYSVRAYDQMLSSNQPNGTPVISEVSLGSATTDAQGRYRITYETSQLVRPGSLHADLVIRVRTSNNQTSPIVAESPPLCHAPTTASIDLIVGNVALRGLSEYERVHAAVVGEIRTASIANVPDTQIAYLACTVEQSEDLVNTLVKAHRLSNAINVDAIVLYGILRQGFSADADTFLRARPLPMQEALERSMSDNIIPPMSTPEIDTAMDQIKARMAGLILLPDASGGTALGELLAITLADSGERTLFVDELLTHEDANTFWTALASHTSFPAAKIDMLQRMTQWAVLSRYHTPLVVELANRFTSGTVTSARDLAKYDEDDWYAILETIGAPSDIPGATADEKRRNYAKVLERTIETAFPTATIADRIKRAADPNMAGVIQFFDANPDFDFRANRVATYVATTPTSLIGVNDPAVTTARIKSLERLFRLTPRYADEMKPLLDAGLDSALAIRNVGREQFIARFENTAMTKARAEQIFDRASWVAAAATAIFGKYSAQLNNVPVYTLPDLTTLANEPALSAADWPTLFGSADACACEHCQSVYSPSAYLTEVLNFLHRLPTSLPTNDSTPLPQYFSLRDLLIGDLDNRPNAPQALRPDIARIKLSCENTETTLPYLDIVNEILEFVVANMADGPDYTWPSEISTEGDADELLAEPQILDPVIHQSAYVELGRAVHPFDLPWDFWGEEARVYLDHLGVPRHVLLETFIGTIDPLPDSVADNIARERLRLSKFAWEIITNDPAAPPTTTQAYWGMSNIPDWETAIKSVPRFLKQSGLTFEELRELLKTDYLNSEIALVREDGCNLDDKFLPNLNLTHLERLHRFLRLRLCAGLSISEMDRAAKTFGKSDIDDELVRHVADVLALKEEFGLSVSALLPFWGPMGTKSNEWSKSIYEEVFLNRAVLTQSTAFEAAAIGDVGTLAQHAGGILVALRITAAEFALLTSDTVAQALMGLDCVISAAAPMNVANLSILYRVVTFARALGLSLYEYLGLRSLSGIQALDETVDATPTTTRAFVKLVRKIKASALNVGELQYLARHFVPTGMSVGMTEEAAKTLADELRDIVKAIKADDDASPEGVAASVTRERQIIAISEKLATVWSIDASVIQYLLEDVLDPAIEAFLNPVDEGSGENDEERKETLRRLDKLALLTRRLNLGRIEWELTYPDGGPTDWVNPSNIPLTQLNDASGANGYHAQFERLVRFIDLATLRDVLPDKAETLRGVGAAIGELIAHPGTESDFFDSIAELTGWPRADVQFLMEHGFGYSGSPPPQMQCLEERAFLCLHDAIDMLKRLLATAEQVSLWSNIDTTDPAATSLDIKRVARTHYDDAQWSTAARGIRDGLRDKQRDALVHYLVSKDDLDGSNTLFERHLIDVEMSPCQLTSRIKMAIGSAQTFMQRALLGLVPEVESISESAAQWWSWMKNYRVWEAQRKVFVHPENWVEPELRPDKSEFYQTLESRLLQGELTEESAEAAFMEYLESLHDVARLEVAAVCHEFDASQPGEVVNLVHMIARTHTAPHRYYYRKRVHPFYWTPWEKVDVDIQGDHLLATIWNRRLYLFWPVFEEGSAIEIGTIENTDLEFRMRLAWTSKTATGYAPTKVSSGRTIDAAQSSLLDKSSISFATSMDPRGLSIDVLAFLRVFFPDNYYWGWSFVLDPCTGEIEVKRRPNFFDHGWRPDYAEPERMNLVELEVKPGRFPWEDYFRLPSTLNPSNGLINVLLQTPNRFSVYIHRALPNVVASLAPRALFTYTDASREFFVEAHIAPPPPPRSPAQVYPTNVPHIGIDAMVTLEPALQQWSNASRVNVSAAPPTFGLAYRFHTFYHPYVCDFIRALASKGIDGLLRWSQQSPEPLQERRNDFFLNTYQPTIFVHPEYPLDNVDFTFRGAYGHYNWELFFHAPLLIATRLTQNGRYEEADRWYRYIFDPTGGAPGVGPERFWFVRPFRDIVSLAPLHADLDTLATTNPEANLVKHLLEAQFGDPVVEEMIAMFVAWLQNPFDPHLIARSRPYAYQKAVVMKYIDHLLQWGDSLFRRETIEAINEATQIYILAQNILGKRPRIVTTKETTALTYQELIANAAAQPNPLVEVESLIPPLPNAEPIPPMEDPTIVIATYFCLPVNENLVRLWDTVEDRLFKVRHCMDIDGNVRQLPLFEPPIDPALLVRAAAAGLDIGTVLAELNAPLPLYRFSVLLPKAMDFVTSVIAMGNTLLSILEKRDGETLAKLRATQEINLLSSIRNVRQRQIDEAKETLEGLRRSRAVVEERQRHYSTLRPRSKEEKEQRAQSEDAASNSNTAQGLHFMASALRLVPQFHIGTGASQEFGGVQLGGIAEMVAQVFSARASEAAADAAIAGTEAGYKRRDEEWALQVELATRELDQIDKQILAAEIRLDIANKELQNHELSLTNAKEVEEFLRTKFTNEELYVWLMNRAREVYFQGYKLAYDMAKRAERTFQFELASTATFVKADHWDGGKQGLMAAEKLQLDLRRMDAAYIEQNKREYEITKHISLAEVAPIALMQLRGGGECTVELKEGHFDQDWPGHYLRRIKSVSLTVPVTNAPYGSVNCQLVLNSNRVRREAGGTRNEADLRTDYTRTESIVTSTAQNDSGLFELVFRDERYLPFEGLGAISNWHTALKKAGNRFDPTTIHDVVMHLRYMARHDGSSTQSAAGSVIGYRLFSAKTEFPGEWYSFVKGTGSPAQHVLELAIESTHFQPLLGVKPSQISKIQLFALQNSASPQAMTLSVEVPTANGPVTTSGNLEIDSVTFGRIVHSGEVPNSAAPILPETDDDFKRWKLTVASGSDELEDIWLICQYT